MVSIGVFQGGWPNLDLTRTEDGTLVPDGDIEDVHRDRQDILKDQISHGILAEECGFSRNTFTEHHFPASAAEFSPNPLMSQMVIASHTERIDLLNMANIITWHDPIRLAEQVALLDIVSDGRVQVGIGRGYQPKENEVLGQYWGGTVQDQEKNRVSFSEKFEILIKAMTEDLLTYRGEFHNIPPSYTKWHHENEYAYFDSDLITKYTGDDMIDWVDVDPEKEFDVPLTDAGSRLKALFVEPKPIQKPYPPLWQPVTSPRSINFAAERGINGYIPTGSPEIVKRIIDRYMDDVETAGWPDIRPEFDGEPFEYGWDEDRKRGLGVLKIMFNTDAGSTASAEKFKTGLEHKYHYFSSFGVAPKALGLEDVSSNYKPDAETLLEKDIAYMGTTDELIEKIVNFKEESGYHDLIMDVEFNLGGMKNDEVETQMQHFGEHVIPYLEEEFPVN